MYYFNVFLLVGCQNNNEVMNNITKLVYEKLTDREKFILKSTVNEVMMFDLKNLPKDKNYELYLVYEVYYNTEKIKEEYITGILNDSTSGNIQIEKLIINIQENNIRYSYGNNQSYGSGTLKIEEDLKKYSQFFVTSDIELNSESEVYLYHATSAGEFSPKNLGSQIDLDELDKLLKNSEVNVFVKLIYKEI